MFLEPKHRSLSTPERQRKMRVAKAFLLAFAFVAFSYPAFAEDSTLGTLICNVKDNMRAYPYIVNVIAYLAGIFMAVRGFFLLKRHGENASQPQVIPAVAHLIAAGFLISFPAFTGVIQNSIFGKGGGAGAWGCNPGPVTSGSGSSVGLDTMMQNLVKNIYAPMFLLLSIISVAAGLGFLVSGLLKGAKTGTDPRAAEPKIIITHLVFGGILISIGSVLPDVLQSIFGSGDITNMSNSNNLINWSSITGSSEGTKAADNTMRAVLAFVQIIGGIGFLRGWLLVKKALEGGQATVPQGVSFIVGGALAINVDVVLKAIDKTLGTDLIGTGS